MAAKTASSIGTIGRRSLAPLFIAALAFGGLAACGDSDDRSAQEKYCESGASLEASINSLISIDLVSEGTDGLESAVDAIEDDLKDLRNNAEDAAADEVEALEQAVDDLGSALSDLGGDISIENATGVATAVESVSSAAQAVYTTLSNCP